MTVPPIRTLADVKRALDTVYQAMFGGDTIVRASTLPNLLAVRSRAGSGETVVVGGGSIIGVPSGAVNREPSFSVAIASPYSLVAAGNYTIAAGYSLSIAAGGELRVL